VLFNEAKLSIFPLENSPRGWPPGLKKNSPWYLREFVTSTSSRRTTIRHGERDLGNFELGASEIRH
jgi:hypothetical protein